MNINGAFSSHLKADDLGVNKPVVTIDRVEMEQIGKGENAETKPVLYFVGKEKGMVLNITNANMLVELLGTAETDDWIGRKVRLYVTKVDFQGKRVPAIRIDAAPISAVKSKPVPVRKAGDEDEELTASDVGF